MTLLQKLKQAHTMYYVSLVYLIFPIYGVLSEGMPWHILPLTILFAIAYLGLLVVEKASILHLFWLYLCIYVVYTTIVGTPSLAMFTFYLSNILTWNFQEDKKTSFRYLTFYLVLLSLLLIILSIADIGVKIFLSVMVLACLLMTYGMQRGIQQAKLKEELFEKNASINLLLAENERNRIGQDLHDTLGHVFAMMSIKSELALTLMEHASYEQAKQEVQDLRDITKNAMQEVRQIVQALKFHSLEEELQILGNMLELAGIDLAVEGREVEMGEEQEAALTMALRELCNNLIKHSQASSCRIQLSEKDGRVRVLVEDNGIGFGELTGEELYSIRDRLIRYQGRVEIVSRKQPTQIQLDIPKGEKDEHTSS
ncbi:sensor histidine kinase [Streptococcus cuniculi]|uniref:histidine kinase n=1 Tax=Streptococcus cuniculi TaxID=1432788 RepID=A0A4Y9JG41_9STRE|nr:sensor histidine kinase [Streptococcus cuniculi]MBF0777206.1 sensor histidine kinase [Streptococcus cuniculi]TFU98815.1 sensor histidine kinase [Streptococcus cuniculi]